ncbi:MAG: cation transporter, partial [Acidobacteria bacterium]|nr:cation transporter [Acidobacteriota bacterium]
GTSLEEAHDLTHALRDAIAAQFDNADVLIHVEPEGSYRPPDAQGPLRSG